MEVTLIGMGPGGADSLTAAAAEALGRADCLLGSRRLLFHKPSPRGPTPLVKGRCRAKRDRGDRELPLPRAGLGPAPTKNQIRSRRPSEPHLSPARSKGALPTRRRNTQRLPEAQRQRS